MTRMVGRKFAPFVALAALVVGLAACAGCGDVAHAQTSFAYASAPTQAFWRVGMADSAAKNLDCNGGAIDSSRWIPLPNVPWFQPGLTSTTAIGVLKIHLKGISCDGMDSIFVAKDIACGKRTNVVSTGFTGYPLGADTLGNTVTITLTADADAHGGDLWMAREVRLRFRADGNTGATFKQVELWYTLPTAGTAAGAGTTR